MKAKTILIFYFFLAVSIANSQDLVYTIVDYHAIPKTYCELSKKVNETSGLIYFNESLWTFNDSGGKPELYKIEKESGKISQKVVIENAENIDWEDITQDEKYIYIGDFGNNLGNRKDLKIYKISKKNITSKKKIKVRAELIEFSYSNQKSFEVKNRKNNFDCESMISFGDSLIVFTKNWKNKKTRMYKLPKTAGNHKLKPYDTFDIDGLATGADFNINSNKLTFIGYKKHRPFIFLFDNFNGMNFKGCEVFRINLKKLKGAQTEGIIWIDESNILFSTEQTEDFEQKVFQLNVLDVLKYVKN